MLTVSSDPIQPLPTGDHTVDIEVGIIDTGELFDLASINTNGELTVALNGGDNTWSARSTNDLELGPLNGLNLTLFNNDPFVDVIVQGPDSISFVKGDGTGAFVVTDTIAPTAPGSLAASSAARVGLDSGFLNDDFGVDVVTVAPGTNELLVLLSDGSDSLAAPAHYPSGGTEPIVAAIGDVVGNPFPDVVVGHADGSVTYFEGAGDGTLTFRSDLTVSGLGAIFDMSIADFDGDGDNDVAVSGGTQVNILTANDDPLPVSPIANGDFSLALTGWETEIVGHVTDGAPGRINALGGFVQLHENESFLVSLNQSFEIPPTPQTISFDLESLGLDNPDGGVPDSFEVSLLADDLTSLVPTHRAESTSFFNVNPGDNVSVGAGVTFDGRTVTVDISTVPAGTNATLYFDLIGNPPGTGSVASVDNVKISPETIFDDSSTSLALAGPFIDAAGLAHGDVDGDGNLDIVVADAGADKLVVFNGNGAGEYTRSEIDTSAQGSTPLEVAVGPMTAGDSIVDIAATMFGSSIAITPLTADTDAPMAMVTDPDISGTVTTVISAITLTFNEPVIDAGPTADNSVTNPTAYTLTNTTTGEAIPVTSVAYESVTQEVTLTFDNSLMEDGDYVLSIEGDDETAAIEDTSGNQLGGGTDQTFGFTLNAAGPLSPAISMVTGDEGREVAFSTTFSDPGGNGTYTATIDWGDGSISAGTVTFSSDTGTIEGVHTYADNGIYTVSVTVADSLSRSNQSESSAVIENVRPSLTQTVDVEVFEDELLAITAGTFTDPGFNNNTAGTQETFSATIDWGDGTPVDSATVTVINGGIGTLTSGAIGGSHTYAAPGTYTARVTVIDDDGGLSSTTFSVQVNQFYFTPDLTIADISGNEGQTSSLSGAFTDPLDPGGHVATVDWGDGNVEALIASFANGAGTINAAHAYADDGAYSVSVTVTDSTNRSETEVVVATVSNVAPSVTASANQTANEDELSTFTLATFSDPGFADTYAATVDWGDGTSEAATVQIANGAPGIPTTGSVVGEHSYAAPGNYAVTVTIDDGGGGVESEPSQVTVAAVGPTVVSNGDITTTEGSVTSYSARFTDPGETGSHAATIDWGDGTTTAATVNFSDGAGTLSGDHTYADNGIYAIVLEVSDPSGSTDQATATATVSNADPVVASQGDHTVYGTDNFTLTLAEFSDLGFTSTISGTSETFVATIDWGDGTSSNGTIAVANGSAGEATFGTVSGTHSYALGAYAVTVTVTDDDGGTGATTLTINAVQLPAATTKFFVVNDNSHGQATFRYNADGAYLDQFDLTAPDPRGATTVASGNPLWVVDKSNSVYVYDTADDSLLGSWYADGIKHPEGIATNGTDIWIVDDHKDKIYFYENAASVLSGSLAPTNEISLDKANQHPSGITTDDFMIWVSDRVEDAVYVYDMSGTLLGTWQLDSDNHYASGITINPGGGHDLWVVDRQDDAVYRYTGGKNWLTGNHTADGVFQLNSSNKHPEGIADPSFSINIGDTTPITTVSPGVADDWIFSGAANQTIFVDFLNITGGTLTMSVLDSSGTVLFTDSGNRQDRVEGGP
ncbi:MAG: VCBS repeat-containing protein, partial [Planctomycetales bacterium]|nr:VCBS repeat-containing protein [Planctomycetales bacterium]